MAGGAPGFAAREKAPSIGKEYSDSPWQLGFNGDMGIREGNLCARWAVFLLAVFGALNGNAQRGEHVAFGVPQAAKAEQLFAMANATRAQEGRGRLVWDEALAEAALKHCMRMAAEGPIAHRYGGEPDLTARAADAGAHFSLIEENIAVGSYPATIHQGWLNSPGHRANLLKPDIDHVGIAVVAAQ